MRDAEQPRDASKVNLDEERGRERLERDRQRLEFELRASAKNSVKAGVSLDEANVTSCVNQ